MRNLCDPRWMTTLCKWETLDVYHDAHGMHVSVDEVADTCEEMGAYLAAIARAIARDYYGEERQYYDEDGRLERSNGDAFAAICDGFRQAIK